MKVRLTILLLFVVLFWVVLISFKPLDNKGNGNSSGEIAELVNQLEFLKEQISNDKEIIEAFLEARKSYKVFEWKLEYLSYSWQEFFNGTPSTKIDEQAAGIYKKPPHGLQYLEELICEDANRDVIYKEVNLLINEAKRVQAYLNQSKLNQLQLIEAIQLAFVRWQTLTLVGFEHPCLSPAYSMDEALVLIDVFKKLVLSESGRNKSFTKKESKVLVAELEKIHDLLINATFEDLDRYEIIVSILPQINAQLIKAKVKFPHIKSNWHANSPIDLDAPNVFDKSFINPDFFSSFGRNKSNPTIENLGKAIFFDQSLSKSNELSCATCHQPDKYFADGLVKSISSNANQFLARNTPTLLYTGYQSRWMYSMQSLFLENQMDHVVVNHQEFGTSYTEIIEKLKQNEEYVALFSKAFPELGEFTVSVYSVNLAVASYVRSIAPFNSDFDKYVNNQKAVDNSVKNGFNLFAGKAKCATCHFIPLFNGLLPPHYIETEAEVLGLYQVGDTTLLNNDLGRYLSTPLEEFKRAFKTPTLRNVDKTAPYGHNGCFPDLESVMIFYNQGGGVGYGFEVENQTLSEEKLNLTSEEMHLIIQFMESLTDNLGDIE